MHINVLFYFYNQKYGEKKKKSKRRKNVGTGLDQATTLTDG